MKFENGQVIDGEIYWPNQPDGTPWTEAIAADFIAATLAERTAAAQPTADARPVLTITGIVADAATVAQTTVAPSLDDVTCPAGAVLSISVELRAQDGSVLPMDGTFRMPIRARDGREKLLLVVMTGGHATISAPMRESGVWGVTEEVVNSGLPPESHMAFAGVSVFVFE